ncbi:MAG: hypothetical protein AABZ74_12780 [Cyanobacteriota bacterium]
MKKPTLKSATVKKFMAVLITFSFTMPSVMMQMEREAQAAGTVAGVTIGNQATAKYKDSNNNKFTSTSNFVITKVNAIFATQIIQGPLNTDNSAVASAIQSQNATPNTVVYYPYILENPGNSPDSYKLTASVTGSGNGAKPLTNLKVFLDNDGDGRVSVGDVEVLAGGNTPTLNPDQKVKLVMQYQLPLNAAAGEIYKVNLFASSNGLNTQVDGTAGGVSSDENWNATTITSNAVIAITKSVDHSTANPLEDLIYGFKIDNTGNNGSTYVKFTDNIPTHVQAIVGQETTVANGVWKYWDGLNGTGTQVVTAGVQPTVRSVTFELGVFPGAAIVLPVANSRNISYKVRVNVNAPATTIPNNAKFGYTDHTGANIVDPAGATPQNTNTVTTDINKKSAVLLSPAGPAIYNTFTPFDGTGDAVNNDVAETDATTVAIAPAGTYLFYKNIVRNKGNADDAFDIELDPTSVLPAGSSVTFFRVNDQAVGANNNLPLLDTSNNGKIDTGTIPPYTNFDGSTNAAGEVAIISKVFIPANAVNAAYTAVVKAISTNSGSPVGATPTLRLTDTTRDRITALSLTALDLTNVILGAASNTAPVTFTESANGASVSFPLDVANTAALGSAPDTYNLLASIPLIPGATVQFFSVKKSTTIPGGALVGATAVTVPVGDVTGPNAIIVGDKVMINGQTLTISAVNTGTGVITFGLGESLATAAVINTTLVAPLPAPISSSGVINPQASQKVVAVVSVPVGTAPVTAPITFTQVSNNNSGTSDQIIDAVVVPQFKDFRLDANRSGSGPAGGVLFYDHIVTNTGNIADTYTLTVPSVGPKGLLYQLIDTAGVPSPTNSITTPSIAINGTYTFKVKVTIPQGTANGTVDTILVTAKNTNPDTTKDTRTNTDITSVVDGFLSLVKTVQTFDGATGLILQDATGALARPNDILEYVITFTNIGSSAAIESVIEDIIPADTTYVAGSLKIGAVVMLDPADADGAEAIGTPVNSVRYRVGTGVVNTPTFTGGSVAQGATGTVTFRVRVK